MGERTSRSKKEGMLSGEGRHRERVAHLFRLVEHGYYVAVALALSIAGAILFVQVSFRFIANMTGGTFPLPLLEFLDGLLLVFIIAELIHTIRAVIDENVLMTEPFLIVGIVAAIRRMIVITAEAKEEIGRVDFSHLMLELGILSGTVLLLGVTIFLVRNTQRSEPTPAHEPGDEEEGG